MKILASAPVEGEEAGGAGGWHPGLAALACAGGEAWGDQPGDTRHHARVGQRCISARRRRYVRSEASKCLSISWRARCGS